MSDRTQADVLEAMMMVIPHADQIRNIDLSQSDQIRFDWRGDRYMVCTSGHTGTIRGDFEHGDSLAILMRTLIERGHIQIWQRRQDEQRAAKKAEVPA